MVPWVPWMAALSSNRPCVEEYLRLMDFAETVA